MRQPPRCQNASFMGACYRHNSSIDYRSENNDSSIASRSCGKLLSDEEIPGDGRSAACRECHDAFGAVNTSQFVSAMNNAITAATPLFKLSVYPQSDVTPRSEQLATSGWMENDRLVMAFDSEKTPYPRLTRRPSCDLWSDIVGVRCY